MGLFFKLVKMEFLWEISRAGEGDNSRELDGSHRRATNVGGKNCERH